MCPDISPLSVRIVGSKENGCRVGADQLATLINDAQLSFANQLCLHVGDGAYAAVRYIYDNNLKVTGSDHRIKPQP